MFCSSILYLLLEIKLSFSIIFFISVQIFISFRLITSIFWYSIPFIRQYFASKRLLVVTNSFYASFFIEIENSKPSSLNFTLLFLYFSNKFRILSFSIVISIGFIFASSSKLCWPFIKIKLITTINDLFLLPNHASCRPYIFLSIVTILFPLTFDIGRFSSLFSFFLLILNVFLCWC